MSIKKHGLSIGINRIENVFFVTIKAVGTLTHDDYLVITPMLEGALSQVEQPKVSLLLDATELEGWELRAAWDDLQLGLKHQSEFERVAVLGNKHWQEWAAKMGSWFMSGEMKYFEDQNDALKWLRY
ncbi:STAS/SEC14 domain-containing protein [Shewanella inventionis]|uniref:STAS/SEC14 domain-containing protein n=1 Tax=Shewanella inventionis TaxID=1738770 RepID=A0ABQ1IY77_9GAMM|nr:STAS/SEC14 domain-containing protein [Shewanella inventionis]MCL1156949.1 STAS/SEC14 domain-containing protein [Shewanella inventionis]UAL43114.1 STAS/SEC14 domain-containing protein [Shewanella inventionis]GGB54052.1 STAS/SEC14 domain-containing protein [Shewanella inventionis]